MKSRMLMSLLVIALAAALIGGATMAWFTDAAQTDEVTFAAGTLMIDVDEELEVASMSRDDLVLDRLNPGDSWTWEFNVYNEGTKSANWLLYMCWEDIVGRDNEDLPEGQVDLLLAREGFGTKGLSEVLQWEIKVGDVVVHNDPLPEEGPLVIDDLVPFGDWDGEPRTQTVSVKATLPGEETDNAYQGSKMNIAFGVKAWQTTNDAPKPTVSKEEDCPFLPQDPGEDPEPDPELAGYEAAVTTTGEKIKKKKNDKLQFNVNGTITAKDQNGDTFDLDGQKSVTVTVDYQYRNWRNGSWNDATATRNITVTFVDGVATLNTSWEVRDYPYSYQIGDTTVNVNN